MKSQAPGLEQQYRRTSWWRKSLLFDLDNGRPEPKHDVGYEAFWRPKAFGAWIHELVRGLVNLKGIGKEICAENMRLLRKLPSFPELSFAQQRFLIFMLQKRLAVRFVTNWSGTHWPETYTLPLPPLSFDREAFSKNAILNFIGKHLDIQDKARGIIVARGKKGCRSRNRSQNYKLGDWTWVELVQPRHGSAPALTRAQQKVRRRAKVRALKHYREVLAAYFLGEANVLTPTFVPLIPGLINKKIPVTQLVRALQRVSRSPAVA